MRNIGWMALGVAAAFLVNVGSVAAEPPILTPAEKLCERQGGEFHPSDVNIYTCRRVGFSFTERELRDARQLCEQAYKGELLAAIFDIYSCVNIG